MKIFNKKSNLEYNANSANERLSEEFLFEQVAHEMDKGELRKGLWLKAFSEGDGDTNKAESIYVKLRIQSLIDEDVIAELTNRQLFAEELVKAETQQKESIVCPNCGEVIGQAKETKNGRKLSGNYDFDQWVIFFEEHGYYYEFDSKGHHAKKTYNPQTSLPTFYFSHTEKTVEELSLWVKNNPNLDLD